MSSTSSSRGNAKVDALLSSVIANARASDERRQRSSPAELELEALRKAERTRRQNHAPFRQKVTRHDSDRIIAGAVDSRVWLAVVRPFMERWEAEEMQFLWLGGPPGIGKTVAALAVQAKHGGFLLSASELARTVDGNNDQARMLRAEALRAPVLILDDVGGGDTPEKADRAREAQDPHVYALVDQRQGYGRCTILTSNLDVVGIERFDSKTISRIKGQGTIVCLKGDDQRLLRAR